MGGLAQAQVFTAMAVSEKGAVHTFWLDTRGMTESMRAALYYRRSDDGGARFEEEVRLQENDQCPCCQVSAVSSGLSSLFVSARQITGDNIRTPTVMYSNDNGALVWRARRDGWDTVATGGLPAQADCDGDNT